MAASNVSNALLLFVFRLHYGYSIYEAIVTIVAHKLAYVHPLVYHN